MTHDDVVDELTAMRAAFDRAFADRPPAQAASADVLAIYAGGVPCAIARDAIAALRTDLRVVALPTPARALLGVASYRGALLPVWDLGRLAFEAPVRAVRWCAIARGEAAAFAFDGLAGHVRVAAPLGVAIEHADVHYPILDLARVLAREGARHGK